MICPHCGHTANGQARKGQEQEGRTVLARASAMAGWKSQSRMRHGALSVALRRMTRRQRQRWDDGTSQETFAYWKCGEHLPEHVTCPDTGVNFNTGMPEEGRFRRNPVSLCAACGTVQDVLRPLSAKKTGPHRCLRDPGLCARDLRNSKRLRWAIFSPIRHALATVQCRACRNGKQRKDTDLKAYWPQK